MPDVVTREERSLIEAALAATPIEDRRVPKGATGLPEIKWDGGALRYVGITNGWRGLAAARSRGSQAAGRAARSRVADRNARICADARAGMTYPQLMVKYELSRHSIYAAVARSGLRVTPVPREFTNAEVLTAKIVALADGVRTVPQIAAEAGCSSRSVRYRRDLLGLDIPHGLAGKPIQWRAVA